MGSLSLATGLDMFLLETGGGRLVAPTDFDSGGSAGLARSVGMGLGGCGAESAQSVGCSTDLGRCSAESALSIGEHLTTLMMVFLTAVLTSCPSSLFAIVLSSSSDNGSPEGSRRAGDKGPDNRRAALDVGKS